MYKQVKFLNIKTVKSTRKKYKNFMDKDCPCSLIFTEKMLDHNISR